MKISKKTKNTASIVVGAIGFVSSIGLFAISVYVTVGLIVATILSVIVIYYVLPQDNLPDGMDAIAEEMENHTIKKTVKVVFPCDSTYYKAANKLAKEKFGKNSVSTRTVNDWKKRNEFILTCLTDKNKMVGYFDILPLKKDFAEGLIRGDFGEKDITAEHILGVHEMKDAEYIYFAGIAVEDTGSGIGCIHGTYLIWAATLYTQIFYAHSSLKKILTIPTSECGLKITKHLKFSLEKEGKLREDGYDIYSKEFKIDDLWNTISKNDDLYKRFDASAYIHAFQKLTGKKASLPIILDAIESN